MRVLDLSVVITFDLVPRRADELGSKMVAGNADKLGTLEPFERLPRNGVNETPRSTSTANTTSLGPSCYVTPNIRPSTWATVRSAGVMAGLRNAARLPSRSAPESQPTML